MPKNPLLEIVFTLDSPVLDRAVFVLTLELLRALGLPARAGSIASIILKN
ncbi:MAG TPA: hypothetical protein VKM93_14705 [Terriglobia bacterium]|nr:hypothetical protein [Terriglobia bacterium]